MPRAAPKLRESRIHFSAGEVSAILAGTKTQVRTLVAPAHDPVRDPGLFPWEGSAQELMAELGQRGRRCPHGGQGDRLYVRESFRLRHLTLQDVFEVEYADGAAQGIDAADLSMATLLRNVEWQAGDNDDVLVSRRWYPSGNMPRAASRIVLEIVACTVERLSEVGADARRAAAEGVRPVGTGWTNGLTSTVWPSPAGAFYDAWDKAHGAGSAASDPWVWVTEFRRVDDPSNLDAA